MLPPHLADDLLAELRGDIDRAKARILDSLLERLERLSSAPTLPDDDDEPAPPHSVPDGVRVDDDVPTTDVPPGAAPEDDEEVVVVRPAAAAPAPTPKPPRARRRTAPPGPVDPETVEDAPGDESFAEIPF